MPTKKYIDELTYKIIGCAIEVHKALGPGLLESIYEKCLIRELILKNLAVRSQIKVPIHYKGMDLEAELRLDLLVEELVIVEIKAAEALNAIYEAQILSYMKLLEKPKGILINFCTKKYFQRRSKNFCKQFLCFFA